MKKIFLVALVLVFSFAAKAQKHKIDIGVETGLSLIGAQILPRSDNYSVIMFEYNEGLTLLYYLTENLAFRTGLFHMNDYGTYRKIDIYPDENLLFVSYANYQGKSINVPLALRGSYGRRFRVFFEAGIVPGYEYKSLVRKISKPDTQNTNADLIANDYTPTESFFSKRPFFRTLIDLRAGCNFQLSTRFMLEVGAGLYLTTRHLDLSTDPDFISGKIELPAHLSLYYKI